MISRNLLNLFFCLVFFSEFALAQTKKEPNVLYLNSNYPGFKWSDEIHRGVRYAFDSTQSQVNLYVEFMEAKLFPEDKYTNKLADIYKLKYDSVKFDLIICSDENALRFLKKFRDSIFTMVPVVFCGINRFSKIDRKVFPYCTGVTENPDFEESINIALKLHPNLKEIVVINERTISGEKSNKGFELLIPKFKDRVKIQIFEYISMKKLLKKLKLLTSENIIFFAALSGDKSSHYIEYDESLALIRQNSKVPIYAAWEQYLGKGIVGGKMINGFDQGKTAALIALKILKGQNIDSIPVVNESPSRYMFDFEELTRFNIEKSSLPDGSIIIKTPDKFYDLYKEYIWGLAGFIIFLTFIIFLLLINIQKRRKIERRLKDQQFRLEKLVEERTEELKKMNENLTLELMERMKIEEQLRQAYKLFDDPDK